MAKSKFERAVAAAKALKPTEQWRLLEMLEAWLTPGRTPLSEEEFAQEMLRQGILDQVAAPWTDPADFDSYKPIEIKGKPLSETIIEERG